jgi:undecaprenyl-diphosphatase
MAWRPEAAARRGRRRQKQSVAASQAPYREPSAELYFHERTSSARRNFAMTFLYAIQILVLAVVQGLAELLPVSSSAHVTVVARLIGFDIGSDEKAEVRWTFLIIMLHTGTMFAVLIYFWSRWKPLLKQIPALLIATAVTGVVGFGLKKLIERAFLYDAATAKQHEIEHLFQNFPLMASALAAAGALIVISGLKDSAMPATGQTVGPVQSAVIGLVQGLCLPFRGFSRSGATISTGMLLGIARSPAEVFSFALAVILTPGVIVYEGLKLVKVQHELGATSPPIWPLLAPGLLGMTLSFAAGLVALRWLSRWLEKGRWSCFGYYCLLAAAVVLIIHFSMPAG